MDKKDTTRLFRLLGEIYPSAPEFGREESMLAWQLVLEPFAYEDVKEAAVEWARRGVKREYPPRASELAAKLTPAIQEAAPMERTAGAGAGEAWLSAIETGRCVYAADELGNVSRYARENGITWQEAKEALHNGA